MDFLQAFQRQAGSGLAVRTVFIGRRVLALNATKGLGLTNGLSAGSARLCDLPQEGPEGQAQIPTPVAGVAAFVLLGQTPAGNPQAKEQFQLMEVGTDGGA